VLQIRVEQQRLIHEHLFGLGVGDGMFERALSVVARIPFEADDVVKVDHFCILPTYTPVSLRHKVAPPSRAVMEGVI
jgi:hypothetical protein